MRGTLFTPDAAARFPPSVRTNGLRGAAADRPPEGIVSYATSRLLFDSAGSIGSDEALTRIAADEANETVVAALFPIAAVAIYRGGRVPDRADRFR